MGGLPHQRPLWEVGNSPALHCWDKERPRERWVRPGGTPESTPWIFRRPSGTRIGVVPTTPSDESLGYCQASLRDERRGVSGAKDAVCRGRKTRRVGGERCDVSLAWHPMAGQTPAS